MRRPLTVSEDIERTSLRAVLASPLGKGFRPPPDVMQSPEYKSNSLMFMVNNYVRELVRNACSKPVQAKIRSEANGAVVSITWDNNIVDKDTVSDA